MSAALDPGQFTKVLTLDETARLLRVHTSTVYRLLKSGELRAFKLGRVWRFNVEDIDRWRLETVWPASGRHDER